MKCLDSKAGCLGERHGKVSECLRNNTLAHVVGLATVQQHVKEPGTACCFLHTASAVCSGTHGERILLAVVSSLPVWRTTLFTKEGWTERSDRRVRWGVTLVLTCWPRLWSSWESLWNFTNCANVLCQYNCWNFLSSISSMKNKFQPCFKVQKNYCSYNNIGSFQ